MYTVYMHISPNGKKYIGITGRKPERRWGNGGSAYKAHNPHFWNAIQKYGWENFNHKIIKEGINKEEACEMEISLISMYKATNPDYGYNSSTGGELSGLGVHKTLSEETKRKISIAQKGKKIPKEVVEKMVASRAGYKHSEETKEKIRKAKLGKKPSEQALNHMKVPIIMLTKEGDFVREFNGIKDAAIFTGNEEHKKNICSCCRGKIKSAYGYIWKYKNGGGRNV